MQKPTSTTLPTPPTIISTTHHNDLLVHTLLYHQQNIQSEGGQRMVPVHIQSYQCNQCKKMDIPVPLQQHFFGCQNKHYFCIHRKKDLRFKLIESTRQYRSSYFNTRTDVDSFARDLEVYEYINLIFQPGGCYPPTDIVCACFIFAYHLIAYGRGSFQWNEFILNVFYRRLINTFYRPLLYFLFSKHLHSQRRHIDAHLFLLKIKNFLIQYQNDPLFLNFVIEKQLILKGFGCLEDDDDCKNPIFVMGTFSLLVDIELSNLYVDFGLSHLGINTLQSYRSFLVDSLKFPPFHTLIGIVDVSLRKLNASPPPNPQSTLFDPPEHTFNHPIINLKRKREEEHDKLENDQVTKQSKLSSSSSITPSSSGDVIEYSGEIGSQISLDVFESF